MLILNPLICCGHRQVTFAERAAADAVQLRNLSLVSYLSACLRRDQGNANSSSGHEEKMYSDRRTTSSSWIDTRSTSFSRIADQLAAW